MGKSIIVKGADFSAVAIAKINLFDASLARRNYAVWSQNDTSPATIKTFNGFCVTPYITIPTGAKKIRVTGYEASGAVRFRFTKTTSDSEAVPQWTGLAGIMSAPATTDGNALMDVPTDSEYIYFTASIFRGASAAAATAADLSNVRVEAIF